MTDHHEITRGAPADDERAVYVISVAAELAGVHPQTLRIYERKGLVRPQRTQGNSRRYSARDIEILRRIQDLTQERGINLAGVKAIIEMQAQLDALRRRTEELEAQLRSSRRAAQKAQARREAGGGPIVPLRSVFLPPWEGGRR
jgi:MerR family transcriptional regulator/heat shock protein HspR